MISNPRTVSIFGVCLLPYRTILQTNHSPASQSVERPVYTAYEHIELRARRDLRSFLRGGFFQTPYAQYSVHPQFFSSPGSGDCDASQLGERKQYFQVIAVAIRLQNILVYSVNEQIVFKRQAARFFDASEQIFLIFNLRNFTADQSEDDGLIPRQKSQRRGSRS